MNTPVTQFIEQLNQRLDKPFHHVEERRFAGVSFLFIQPADSSFRPELEEFLTREALLFAEGTAWFHELEYIRTSKAGIIYRFRFRVPEEKSFCCGNRCSECILKKYT
jgi:hypothetical protein